ncbi:MAG: cell division protein FtsZ, partial [Rhodospirillales bacterium]|nr:cell division protein FtsZ [Rhodospirillales bacterium]
YSGVRGITDLIVNPGIMNLDFADVRSAMSQMGKAMMGTGEAKGERRALDAAEAAIANPLLDEMSMKGANGVLINITGGMDITLFEVDEAANRIRAEVDEDAYIIVGSAFDSSMDGLMRVSVVATGIDASAQQMPLPTMLHLAEQLEQTKDYRSVTKIEAEVEAEAAPEPVMEADPEPVSEFEPEPELETETSVESDAEEEEAQIESQISDSTDEAQAESVAESAQKMETEAPPPAMPSVGATDAFIPPVAATAGDAEDVAGSEPVAEIAEDSSESNIETQAEPDVAAPRKGMSLFERVTGGSRTPFGKKTPAPVESLPESPEVTENKELSSTEEVIEPKPEEAQPDNATTLDEVAESVEEETQLGGMDPEDRITTSESDEDLLDIPAFLRRQAN